MTSIISRGGHALVDSNSDACHNDIIYIICMATDILCIIREDYRLPPSVQPPIFSDQPSVQPPTFLDPLLVSIFSMQHLTFLYSPFVRPHTFSNPPSVQPFIFSLHPPSPTFSDSLSVQPSTFSDPPLESILVLIDIVISTQLDLPPIILRGRRGLRLDLTCCLHYLYFKFHHM